MFTQSYTTKSHVIHNKSHVICSKTRDCLGKSHVILNKSLVILHNLTRFIFCYCFLCGLFDHFRIKRNRIWPIYVQDMEDITLRNPSKSTSLLESTPTHNNPLIHPPCISHERLQFHKLGWVVLDENLSILILQCYKLQHQYQEKTL